MATSADDLSAIDRLLVRPAWHHRAACRGLGPAAWFPTRGEDRSAALGVCERCVVARECADAGAAEHFGIWGGLTARQRRPLRLAVQTERR